jgi:phosphatidylethanolamine-binding protein (PEBP) family uncharacterized protein
MRRLLDAPTAGLLVLVLALAGCGGSSSSSAKVMPLEFGSPVVSANGKLPTRYTCAGKNLPLPLEWGAVPADTTELALFVLGLTPNPATGGSKIAVQWAVTGLKPTLHRLFAGKPPPGASLGLNSSGRTSYSLCPAKGTSKSYLFIIYALPAPVLVQPGFQGLQLLGRISSTNLARPSAEGQFGASYKRA